MRNGPLLTVEVSVDARRAAALTKLGKPIPQAITGSILVDTGASMTCIEASILIQLGIPDIGDATVYTPSGKDDQKVYFCRMGFPGSGLPSITEWPVLGAKLKQQNCIGLLGRDVLSKGLLVYNGHAGSFTLAF